MSAPSSTPWPRSAPSSAEPDDAFEGAFEGAAALARAWSRGLRPDPQLTVWEWADRHRRLSPRGSAEPGPYRTDRAPYLREIMAALSPGHPARRVVFMKSAQVGATEAGNNWIGYVIHHAPGPMLSVLPTLDVAKRVSRQRIDPMIAESPALRERVRPARSRDGGNTILSKDFPGGTLVMTGANSAVGLRSMPARYLFMDEVDGFPPSADDEGDPVALAEQRAKTFGHRRKILLVSTPTVRGLSRIEREWEATDRRRYFVPCPHCGEMQWLQFPRLRWAKGRPETAAYLCEGCGRPIAEHHKTAMLAVGEWRATAVSTDPHAIGFHVSALYSPVGWESWEAVARSWEAAQGSEERLRAFVNTVLGETWTEKGEAPEWSRLMDRREARPHASVPEGGLYLTAGADVQRDRIEVDVWAWGRGLESWLVEHLVFEGGPDRPECLAALTGLLGRTWPHARGARLALGRLAIDTGYQGAAPSETAIYNWARRQGAQVMAVKGVEGAASPVLVAGPTYVDATESGRRLRRGLRLWTVATSAFKQETYRFLRLDRATPEELAAGGAHPPGTVHLPDWIESEWIRQLVGEELVTVRDRRGFSRREWRKLRERNEALDCRVYARAAAWIAGMDRWPEATWRDLEAQVAPPETPPGPEREAETPEGPAAGRLRAPRRSRRAVRPSYL